MSAAALARVPAWPSAGRPFAAPCVAALTCAAIVHGEEAAPRELPAVNDARPIELNAPQPAAGTLRFSSPASAASSQPSDGFVSSGTVLRWKSRQGEAADSHDGVLLAADRRRLARSHPEELGRDRPRRSRKRPGAVSRSVRRQVARLRYGPQVAVAYGCGNRAGHGRVRR